MEPATLGFLVMNHKHENSYVTNVALQGKHYNIQCVRFEPTSIDPSSLLISGERFDTKTQNWVVDRFPIPSFIYDRCFYNKQRNVNKSRPIVEWLKKYPKTTFLGFGLPDKWMVYTSLQTDSMINSYLIKTERLLDVNQLLYQLKKDSSCILKPISGSRGVGIIAVTQSDQVITLTYHKGTEKKARYFSSKDELADWCRKLLRHSSYLIQPLLPLLDKEGYPVDIRMFIQKDHTGNWRLIGKGVRKGYQGSFLSNLYSGGTTISYKEWCSSLTEKQYILLEDELNTIVERLPPLLEQKYNRLFEIGVDIGYVRDGSVWILDINSKPGRKTITETIPGISDKIYEAPLAYCRYLAAENASKSKETR